MAITKIPAAGFTGNNFRNIIINGDMSIAQRGTSGTLQNGTGGYLCLDRWNEIEGGSESFVFTVSQDSDVPTGQGFAKSLKFDCTTADASLAADGALTFRQKIEGQNLQYLKKGTANAESTTISFWVKSVKTGTYIIALVDVDNSRSISKAYTIDDASTWEKKTLTFAGDTSGALGNDNGNSLQVEFYLGAGSNYTSGTLQTSWGSNVAANQRVGQVNLADSTDNNFWITGVQLEAGTTASDFEFLPFDVNLQRCERYCFVINSSNYTALCNGYFDSTTSVRGGIITFPTTMRASPTITSSGTLASFNIARPTTSNAGASGLPTATQISKNSYELLITSAASSVSGYGTRILATSDAVIKIDGEL